MTSLEPCKMSILNANQLDLLKQHLLSRNVSQQLEAVNWLINIMKSGNMPGGSHIPDIIINADIAEYLSEAMATHHNDLLHGILLCLEQLLVSKNFFFERRALYTVDCLLRAINFLLKQTCNTEVLTQALKVLSIILKKTGSNHCGSNRELLSTTCNVDQITNIMKSVLQHRMDKESETVLASCSLFYSFLFHINSEFTDKFIQGLDICLESLAKLILSHGTSPVANESVQLLSKIGLTLLGSHTSSNQPVQNKDDCVALMAEHQVVIVQLYDLNYIIKKIFEYLSLYCFPYIMNPRVYTQSYNVCESVLKCVHLLYLQAPINIKDISEQLVNQEFLVHLPILMNIAHMKENRCLINICVLVLADLLTNLSSLILNIDNSWTSGVECFRNLIEEGLLNIKTGINDWFQHLRHTNNMIMTETIIVFFYFLFLFSHTENCRLDALSISMCINQYPCFTKYPIPLRKAVLFVFAVSVLSFQSHDSEIIVNKATGIMIKMIESCGLDKLYTHHPALLYWAFTCMQMSYSIKCEMVKLWLLKEENDTGDILMHLALLTPDASFCIMDVVQNGHEILVKRGICVLKKAVLYEQNQNQDKIISLIWNMLPRLLAKLSSKTNPLFVHVISRTLNLAALTVPFNPNITDMIAAATFLTHLLPRLALHSVNLSIAVAKYSLCLLLTSVELGDYRVLSILLKDHKFVQALVTAIQTSELDICIISLKLLCFLFTFQIKLQSKYQLRCERSFEIDGIFLLKLLNHDDINILSLSLHTTQLLMNQNIEKPLLKVASNRNEKKLLLALFSNVQDIFFKKLVGIVDSCWKCLGAIIEYAAVQHKDVELLELLATQPWTHALIKITLSNGCSQLTNEFFNFVNSWLMYYQKPRTANSIREERKTKLPSKTLLTVSAIKLAEAILRHFENLISMQHVTYLTLQRILNSDAELPNLLETAVMRKIVEMDPV